MLRVLLPGRPAGYPGWIRHQANEERLNLMDVGGHGVAEPGLIQRALVGDHAFEAVRSSLGRAIR